MEFTGEIKGIQKDWSTGQMLVAISVNEIAALKGLEALKGTNISIEVKKARKKRSRDANALLWACIGEIAGAINADKWDVYLKMLKRYGQYTYICVKPNAVEAIKAQWRECEEIGEVDIHGTKSVQLLCYYGSHTYNTFEFKRLLDGVISEMTEMGLQTPASEEMRRSLEEWGKRNSQ